MARKSISYHITNIFRIKPVVIRVALATFFEVIQSSFSKYQMVPELYAGGYENISKNWLYKKRYNYETNN